MTAECHCGKSPMGFCKGTDTDHPGKCCDCADSEWLGDTFKEDAGYCPACAEEEVDGHAL